MSEAPGQEAQGLGVVPVANFLQRLNARTVTIAVGAYWLTLFLLSIGGLAWDIPLLALMPVALGVGLPLLLVARGTLMRSSEQRPVADQLAYVDDLTGLHNRRSFMVKGARLVQSSKPGASSLILLDVDGLKSVNDECGHQAGDELLQQVSAHLSLSHPAVYRIGGDEFAILVDRSQGESVTALMRTLTPLEHHFRACGHDHTIQFSYGFASRREDETFEQLFGRADARLRQFKHRLYSTGTRQERRIAHLTHGLEADSLAAREEGESASATDAEVISIFSRRNASARS